MTLDSFLDLTLALLRQELRHNIIFMTFHFTGCLIGILIMVYHNPHKTV